MILKETKFDCIKSLFISYLKYLNRNTKNKKDDDIIKLISYIDKNKDLLNQNDMIRESNTMISLYCFHCKPNGISERIYWKCLCGNKSSIKVFP